MERAILSQKVKAIIVHPTEVRFKHMVRSKLLNNFYIKVDNVTNTHNILGPDLSGVREKQQDINQTGRKWI